MPDDILTVPYDDEFNPDRHAAWLRRRCGRLTSSRMADAMSFTKGTKNVPGRASAKRWELMRDLCAERALVDQNVRHYVTPEMEWGLKQQSHALAAYEAETGVLADHDQYRFTTHPDYQRFFGSQPGEAMLGASDDGWLGRDGIIEIKCPSTPTYIGWVWEGAVPEAHKPQMIVELECAQRTWCDFVAYDPRIRRGPRLFIARYEPTQEERQEVLRHAEEFLRELEEMFHQFTHG